MIALTSTEGIVKMSSTPRPIFLSTALEAPPITGFAIGEDVVTLLYNAMREPGGYAYDNLNLQGDPPCLTTRRGKEGKSKCEVGPYLVKVKKHLPEMPVDEFVGVVKTILTAIGDDCPPFMRQKTKIKCLMQPSTVSGFLGYRRHCSPRL